MSTEPTARFSYLAHAHAFLTRAQEALAAFDSNDDVGALLQAALELRFGIEARLYQYIDAELGNTSTGRNRIKEYSATKLLAQLTGLNPKAASLSILRITSEQDGSSSTLYYTPVTRELAQIHGQLGNLLHYSYFWQNPHWFLKRRLSGPGLPALLHARDLVAKGIGELQKATSGSLLNNPVFKAAVEKLAASPSDEPVDFPNDAT